MLHIPGGRVGPLGPVPWMTCKPRINLDRVRFLSPEALSTDIEHDRHTDRPVTRIERSGESFFGGTTWNHRRCMRLSVCNWRTTAQDLDRAVMAIEKILKDP